MRAPVALAAIPFLAGAGCAVLVWPLPHDAPVVAVGGAALALLAAAVSTAEDDVPCGCVSTIVGCVLAGVALGWIAADRAYNPPLLQWQSVLGSSHPVNLEGVLREDAATTPFGASIVMDVDRVASQPTAGGVRLSILGSLSAAASGEWRRGRRIRLPASLRRPSVYRDPGVPDEARALARRGICLVGSVKSAALVERLANGSPLQEAAAAARAWARRCLIAAIGPTSERSAAVATAILIGDRNRLSDEDEQRLQRAGTYHVIAISGGNIAIVAVALMLVARALFLPAAPAAALTILALLFYGQITGPAASVERAITAAVVFLAARLVDHRGPPINALGVAALVAVASSPAAVLDPGFILSFGATLGILLGAPMLLVPPRRVHGRVLERCLRSVGRGAAAVLAATISAELTLAPVGAALFGRVALAGLLLNFAAIPLMTTVQIAGAAILALHDLWSASARCLVWLAHASASGLLESARLVEVAPWLSLTVHPPSWPMLTLYYGACAALLSRRVRRLGLAVLAAVAGLMLVGPSSLARHAIPPSRFPLRVVVLDVGQGDATVVSLPGAHTLLVDAGGVAAFSSPPDDGAASGFDVGERVVVPAMRALGVSRLDGLVLTHGDPDHMLGAPAVIRANKVRSVWEGVPVPRHPGLRTLQRIARAAGVSWRTVQAGDVERFGDVELRVLHPPPPEWERQRVRNEDSIVLELRLGDVSVILAGDVGREGERAMLSRLEPGRLTVLKAGHHGSATSSTPELLGALHPAAVIFSAGRDNRFGHPHPAVQGRFEAIGAAVFRTDQDGAVFIETDGKVVQMRGWTGRGLSVQRTTR